MVSLCKPAWISVILFGIFTVPSYATVTNHIQTTRHHCWTYRQSWL